jgi:hypothetical protein
MAAEGAMKNVIHGLMLVLLAALLQQCAPVQGCALIAQKSEGPCRVGLPLGWYGDDAWRDQ